MISSTAKNLMSQLSPLSKNNPAFPSMNATSFSQELFHLIDTKGLTDVDVYTRANVDRKLFSKIRRHGYLPSKKTIIALALALKLDYAQSINLLNLAGFTLSTSAAMPFDIIITWAITSKTYDIQMINEKLFEYDLPTL